MACPKILIVLPEEALRRLNAYAAHKGVARSSVVRAAIERLISSDGFVEAEQQIALDPQANQAKQEVHRRLWNRRIQTGGMIRT